MGYFNLWFIYIGIFEKKEHPLRPHNSEDTEIA